jgi:hypothetical protein
VPLPAERLSALQLELGTESALRTLKQGETLIVRLSPEETLQATVEAFVEQWGGANPQVQIGVVHPVNVSLHRIKDLAETGNMLHPRY